MGFKRQRTVRKFVWPEGSEFHGLEVYALVDSFASEIAVLSFLDSAKESDVDHVTLFNLTKAFVSDAVGWNFERADDTPVKLTLEAMLDLERAMVTAIVVPWRDEVIRNMAVSAMADELIDSVQAAREEEDEEEPLDPADPLLLVADLGLDLTPEMVALEEAAT